MEVDAKKKGRRGEKKGRRSGTNDERACTWGDIEADSQFLSVCRVLREWGGLQREQ